MEQIETLEEFYRRKFSGIPANVQHEIGDFNVFSVADTVTHDGEINVRYARRDFYKISLIDGENLFHYADKSLHVKGPCLIFFNPKVPYKWEGLSKNRSGYFCIFKDAFFIEKLRHRFSDLPMFAIGGKPSYILNDAQYEYATGIFKKIFEEVGSDYKYKQDLLVSYVTELIHYALKMQPSETLSEQTSASSRITAVFTDLLERQFPIESPQQRFTLRSASDYAQQLFVHVNHLNRSIKEVTGKTTSVVIAERLAAEARALLKHTDWNISDISYCLGFEDPSHFTNFFRKYTASSPGAFRQS